MDCQLFGRPSPRPEERLKVMTVFNGLSALMALSTVVALYSTYLGTPEIKWSIYVAGAFCMVIAVHQMISFAFALELQLRSRRARKDLPQTGVSGKAEGRRLEGHNTGEILKMPSVTENTTELFRDAPQQGAITKPQI